MEATQDSGKSDESFEVPTATDAFEVCGHSDSDQATDQDTLGFQPYVEATAALQEEDPTTQETMVTQFCKDAILDCGILGMTNPYLLDCYWPWVENYYGEIDAAAHSQIPMIREMWINQTLKTQDGY